jgi:ABC-type antimicrobial peptide transport system permease subunit
MSSKTKSSTVLGFTALISILTGIVAGVLPALRLTRADVSQAIKQGLGHQASAPATGGWNSFPMTLIVRSTTNPTGIVSAVGNAGHEVDREIPVRAIFTMDDLVTNSMSQQRSNILLRSFAGLALLLDALGIYCVLSYSVKRRVQEIGIRLALGARIEDVLGIVIVEGMKPTLLGVALGTTGALAMGHVLSSLIYGVKPHRPRYFPGGSGSTRSDRSLGQHHCSVPGREGRSHGGAAV